MLDTGWYPQNNVGYYSAVLGRAVGPGAQERLGAAGGGGCGWRLLRLLKNHDETMGIFEFWRLCDYL